MNNTAMTGRQRMVAALRLQRVDRPPVWFMRQAGRHLPGYRGMRERHSFMEICRDEALNVEVSAEPWQRYGVDGAIVFNDILTPLADMGMGLDFAPGPRFEWLVAAHADLARLHQPAYGPEVDVSRCIKALRQRVGEAAAVLGFVGAPFTVASFAINGSGPQRRGPLAVALASQEELFTAMQERLLDVLADYAAAQVDGGADVIQIFESLADEVDPIAYRRFGLPGLLSLVAQISERRPRTPVIIFGRGLWPHLADLAASQAAALSIDPTVDLARARRVLAAQGSQQALQGNLDPEVLRQEPLVAGTAAFDLLSRWREIVPLPGRIAQRGPTGWVFNLGHGVPADANPAAVEAVVEVLRAFDFQNALEEVGR
jgi:uroporphyrinogen decarboxylase